MWDEYISGKTQSSNVRCTLGMSGAQKACQTHIRYARCTAGNQMHSVHVTIRCISGKFYAYLRRCISYAYIYIAMSDAYQAYQMHNRHVRCIAGLPDANLKILDSILAFSMHSRYTSCSSGMKSPQAYQACIRHITSALDYFSDLAQSEITIRISSLHLYLFSLHFFINFFISVFMSQYYTVFDQGKDRLGFAKAK